MGVKAARNSCVEGEVIVDREEWGQVAVSFCGKRNVCKMPGVKSLWRGV